MTGRFENLYEHAPHRLWQVAQWKLGLRGLRPNKVRPAGWSKDFETLMPGGSSPMTSPPAGVLQWTWIGHASFLLQGAGLNILIDPVFSTYCFPVPGPRLKRLHPPGLALESLPPIHVGIITHSHYDHLDRATVRRLGADVTYGVPAGLGCWFRKRGRNRVVELGWWESASPMTGLRLHCLPAQHFSARTWRDLNQTLWCGWLIELGDWKIYVAGDTGYCPVFTEIGERFGPMDLAILPIGAYEPRWLMQPIHVNPEESVQIHQDVRSRRSVASHWGTFDLTDEPIWEPPMRLRAAVGRAGLTPESFQTMRIGETQRLG